VEACRNYVARRARPNARLRLHQAAARRKLGHRYSVNAILLSFLLSLCVNAAFFAVAAIRRTDVVTDLSYSLSFALLAMILPAFGAHEPVQIAASLLVLIWSVRLGGYLLTRILRIKVDHRFDGMRDVPLRFARFWLLQAISVAVIMLPVSYLLGRDEAPGLRLWAVAGTSTWLAGLVIEAVADAQKSAYKAKDENRERFISSGLWRYSRHPNYFGEMLVWWGLFVYAVPFLQGAAFAVVIGPLFITFLLLFVSGIPLLERSAEEKYGDDPAYREYKRRTSILVPLPRRRSPA
jgi:steroid 5-alpha reductase family enzyme